MEKNIDILKGKLIPSILKFTIPIALNSILQQLFNAADTTVVGNFAGSDALAAVGTNSELVAMIVTISSGLAVGANVLIAQSIGKKREEDIPRAITSSLFFALIVGILGLSLGEIFSRQILHAIKAPTKVFEDAVSYLRIYLLGYPFLVIYDFCSAILRGRGDSKRPFIILVISGCINVALNLLFVIVFHKGVEGVAIATDIANAFSCFAVLMLLFKEKGFFRLSFRHFVIDSACIKRILVIGVPAAIQGAVFCFANLFITASVNSFGEIATSGSTISINFEYITYYIASSFGQTATTFISQNYSAGNLKRCSLIFKYCILLGVVFTAVLTIPSTIWSRFFASIFSNNTDVINKASYRMTIVLAIEPFCAIYEVIAGYLRGRGYSLQPSIAAIIGICVVRVAWILTYFRHAHTLWTLFIIYPISWIITNILMLFTYLIIIKSKLIKNHPID